MGDRTARSSALRARLEPRPVVVDCLVADRDTRQFLPHDMGRILHGYVLSHPASDMADTNAGQLYLGVFSGPVEGILLIVGIYVITGLYGMSYLG